MELLGIEKKYEGKFISYYVASFKMQNGMTKLYEFTSRNKNLTMEQFPSYKADGVGMVCFNKDRSKILLQKEFRLACNNWVYNFPAGLVDAGESIEIAAARELKEETGLDLITIEKVLPLSFCSPGTSDELMSIVICTCDGAITNSCFVEEEIDAKWFTKEEVLKLIDSKAYFSTRTQSYAYGWAISK